MRRPFRCGVVVVASLVVLGASPPDQRGDPEQQRTQKEIANSLETIASALNEANKPKREAADCPQGAEDRKSDLCAQWKAADAAQQSADYAWWSLLIGWIGAAFGALTLAAAVAAAVFAKRAADEGAINNSQFRDQAKAKLLTKNYEFALPWQPTSDVIWKGRFDFEAENLGDTSAHSIRFIVHAYLLVGRTRINKMRKTAYAEVIRPGTSEEIHVDIPVARHDFATIAADRAHRVLIRLDKRFTDIFGQTQEETLWMVGPTRDKKTRAGTDHHATQFKMTDEGFIGRIGYKGAQQSR